MSWTVSDVAIQLLVFAGCPLADAARSALEQALAACGLDNYEEVDLLAPETSEALRGWGSPTILVEGKDVTGLAKGHDIGCRVYAGPTKLPEPAVIAGCIRPIQRPETGGAS